VVRARKASESHGVPAAAFELEDLPSESHSVLTAAFELEDLQLAALGVKPVEVTGMIRVQERREERDVDQVVMAADIEEMISATMMIRCTTGSFWGRFPP